MIVKLIRKVLTKRKKDSIIDYKKMHTNRNNSHREDCKKVMDAKILANFLIQEYWRIRVDGQRIKCTRTKVGKLLTIIQILSIKCRQQLAFKDTIAVETCGTSVPILSVLRYPYDIWELGVNESLNGSIFFEKNAKINAESITTEDKPLPDLYKLSNDIDDSLKKIIKDVFLEFGTYDSYEIGKLINQFKSAISLDSVVREEKINAWLNNSDIQPEKSNKIVLFIHNYKL